MQQQFRLKAGETKKVEVHGFSGDTDVGVVPATLKGSDDHTIQVSDNGDGTGTVTAVGAGGATADVTADDGQGHTDTAHGTIESPLVIDRIEVRVLDNLAV